MPTHVEYVKVQLFDGSPEREALGEVQLDDEFVRRNDATTSALEFVDEGMDSLNLDLDGLELEEELDGSNWAIDPDLDKQEEPVVAPEERRNRIYSAERLCGRNGQP